MTLNAADLAFTKQQQKFSASLSNFRSGIQIDEAEKGAHRRVRLFSAAPGAYPAPVSCRIDTGTSPENEDPCNIAYNNTYTWKVDKFSAFHEESRLSEEFHIGEHKWKLLMYPKGDSRAKGESLSLFLELLDCKSLSTERKVYAEYKLRIKDQILHKHCEMEVKTWFSASRKSWGSPNFLPQRDLNDSKKGFLVKDAVIVEVQIILVSTLKDF